MTPLNTKKNITPPHITPIENSRQWAPKEISFIWNALEMGKICIDCQSISTPRWRKKTSLEGTPSQDQCNKCYDVARSVLAKSGTLGKTCVDCQSTSTSQWRKKTSLDGTFSQDQCNKCYQAARSVLAKSGTLGKTCVDCQSTSASQWGKKISLDGTFSQDQCKRCYDAARRSLKRKEDDISISNQNKASKIDFISKKGEV